MNYFPTALLNVTSRAGKDGWLLRTVELFTFRKIVMNVGSVEQTTNWEQKAIRLYMRVWVVVVVGFFLTV
jgi:hypothetical protein